MIQQPATGEPVVRVLLFASLRDQAGWADRRVSLNDQQRCTAHQVWEQLELGDLPQMVRVAINQRLVSLDHPVHNGDELAFLPPFTGG